MDQEQKFREVIEELKLAAEAEGNVISLKKIKKLFKEEDINLTDEQVSLVCDYLKSVKVDVSDRDGSESAVSDENISEEDKDAEFFAMYRHDLRSVKNYSNDELEKLMENFEANKELLIQAFLKDVVKWIEPYKESGVYVCDLVQEGNLGLIEGMAAFSGGSPADLKKHLKESVIEAVKDAIIEQEGEDNVAMKILGRVNSVNDCAREMSQKLGRKVGISELAEKLNMTVEEVQEINELSGYKLENIDKQK